MTTGIKGRTAAAIREGREPGCVGGQGREMRVRDAGYRSQTSSTADAAPTYVAARAWMPVNAGEAQAEGEANTKALSHCADATA